MVDANKIHVEEEAIALLEIANNNFNNETDAPVQEVWKSLREQWSDNENVVLAAIGFTTEDANILLDASERLQGSQEFLLNALRANNAAYKVIPELKGDWCKNAAFMREACAITPGIFGKADESLRGNKELALITIKNRGAYMVSYFSEGLRNDPEVMLPALQHTQREGREHLVPHIGEELFKNADFMIQASALCSSIMQRSQVSADDWGQVWKEQVAARGGQERPISFADRHAQRRAEMIERPPGS